MTYPYRYPLSMLLAKRGVTLSIRIDVLKDEQANVYVATSKDISGLVIESESFSQLREEVSEAIPALLSLENNSNHNHASADILYMDHIAIA
ncbi:MAG: DUF1902 domain-containing protein [Methylophagaceae bacterium]